MTETLDGKGYRPAWTADDVGPDTHVSITNSCHSVIEHQVLRVSMHRLDVIAASEYLVVSG
jgi:hypothetical protein